MMTWMTRMSFFDSAEDLALPQLAMANRESESLFKELVFGDHDPDLSVAPAPLRMMWQGYEPALAAYSVACATILVSHGITNGVRSLEISNVIKEIRGGGDPAPFEKPPWLEDVDFLMSQRSNLMRRWPEAYSFPRNARDMPYLWPIVDGDGGYVLKLSRYDRDLIAKGDRRLPKTIMERIAT